MFAAKNLVVFSTFHIKVQLFCFLLKQFFENMKKSLRSGDFREGRSGYSKRNYFFFFFSPKPIYHVED